APQAAGVSGSRRGEGTKELARSLGPHVLPPLRPGAPIGQHAPLARPAALHRQGHALIATVQAAAPRGQKTAFALPVVGKPVRSVVSNHRAPVRGTDSRGDIPDG